MLIRNKLVQETELDRFQAPEDAAAEEDKLRAEREAKEKQQIKVRIAGVCKLQLLFCKSCCKLDISISGAGGYFVGRGGCS